MNITVESTTDSAKDVLAANAGKSVVEEKVEKTEPVLESKDEDTDESDETGGDAGETDEAKEDKPVKKLGGYQKKALKLAAQLAEKDKELETLRQQVKPKEEKTVEKTVISSKDKPKVEDFDTHAEYVEALTDWKIEAKESEKAQKEADRVAAAKEADRIAEFKKIGDSYQSKLNEFKKTVTDFDEAIDDIDHISMCGPLQMAILDSDIAPKVMYELAKNPAELERINKLGPIAIAKEIGKIETRLSAVEEQETTVKKTNAPPPIVPVGSKGSSKTNKSPDEMTQEEYRAWRKKKK